MAAGNGIVSAKEFPIDPEGQNGSGMVTRPGGFFQRGQRGRERMGRLERLIAR